MTQQAQRSGDDQSQLRLPRDERLAPANRFVRRTYTVREVAAILGVGRNAIYEQVRAGTIPALRLGAAGHKIVIPHDAVDRLLEAPAAQERPVALTATVRT
jgi:excisionase family DNA binding protein